MRIFLIGMPGSGKTYWMKQLAPMLRYKSIDMDEYLTQNEGKTISQLFSEGETYFRERERYILRTIIQSYPDDIVVAAGGGTPCYFDNMQLMKTAGCLIYLDTPLATIQANLLGSDIRRPLLDTAEELPLETKIMQLYLQRREIYEQAHIKIDTVNASLLTFAEAIRGFIDTDER